MPAAAIGDVFSRAGSMLIAALAARASQGREDTVMVFGALMSRDINPRIGDECAKRVDTTGQLKELEHAGFALVARATGKDAAVLSDRVSAQIGVPAQATCALTCICAAILGGLIKHHVLIEQGDISELPGLFASQLATIGDHLNEASIDALGYPQPNVNAFLDTLSVRLAAVAADFEPQRPRVDSEAKPAQLPQIPVHSRYEIGKVFAHDIRFTSTIKSPSPVAMLASAKHDKPRPRRMGKVFALTTASVLIAAFVWAKLYHWPEVVSFVTQLADSSAHGNTTASGSVSSPMRVVSSK
ncbi:hypothetical protein [Paraburkholderia sprentiae]|uniref:hypothetical protein n=1 Tax=Paraburkholderia sprentiae TaxID=948107 RepID=UPI001E3DB3CC|nr:hypothetical protein [Paraburkholderia sprentiae]